jgi:hypothetical protein
LILRHLNRLDLLIIRHNDNKIKPNSIHKQITFRFYLLKMYISLYIIFKEWSKRHIKTWRIVCKLLYCDHPADFILKLRMFDDLCFADRTNGSRIQETMIISVYKQSYKYIKNFISLYFETGNEQQNEQTSSDLLSKLIK